MLCACYLNRFVWTGDDPLSCEDLAGNLVGRGGSAEVYRGVLEDGQAIAVKRMALASSEEQERDFLTELGTVSHVRHPNVSALVGCCIELGFYLIFEFASNGSVSSNIHGTNFNKTL